MNNYIYIYTEELTNNIIFLNNFLFGLFYCTIMYCHVLSTLFFTWCPHKILFGVKEFCDLKTFKKHPTK